MRLIIILLSALLFASGCLGGQPPAQDGGTGPAAASKCDSYSEGPRKVLCYAMERENMSMCAQISGGAFLEECVLVMAELVYNESNVQYCQLSQVTDYQKTCEALTLGDMDRCFERIQGGGIAAGIATRDCIDLVSRKAKDPSLCDTHVSRELEVYGICGQIQDCENQFTGLGAQDNAESCRSNVEYAMGQ